MDESTDSVGALPGKRGRGAELPINRRRTRKSIQMKKPEVRGQRRRVSLARADLYSVQQDQVALVIQQCVRRRIARNALSRQLHLVYRKIFDKDIDRYYYYDIRTKRKLWDPPPILRRTGIRLKEYREAPNDFEAASRIQRMVRTCRARYLLKARIRDVYEKRYDAETKTFFYVNSRTGEKLAGKPVFLANEDLELETFRFRNAVCKLQLDIDRTASGVLVFFRNYKCILTDATSLPDVDATTGVRVQFNHKEDSIPFVVRLRPDLFFLSSKTKLALMPSNDILDFCLCATEEEDFAAAGESVLPIQLKLNDRKLACVESIEKGDVLQILGHPHGRIRTAYDNAVDKLLPNSLKPLFAQYTTSIESGATGAPVFSRGGRLVGIHHQPTLRHDTRECTLISAILNYVNQATVPPVPLLMSTCIQHDSLFVTWEMPLGYFPLRGLDYSFILEASERSEELVDRYEQVFSGTDTKFTLTNLKPNTFYSVRCRAENVLCRGGWSYSLRVKTQPAPDSTWRVKYFKKVADAIDMMEQHAHDISVHKSCVHWIMYHIMDAPDKEPITLNCLKCNAISVLIESAHQFSDNIQYLVEVVYIIQALAACGGDIREKLASAEIIEFLIELLKQNMGNEELTQWFAAAFGFLVRDYEIAKGHFQVAGGITALIAVMEQHIEDAGVIREACYLLAMLAQKYNAGKQHIALNRGFNILAKVLTTYPGNPRILYWACLALGNLACDYPQNRTRAQKYDIVEAVCVCKRLFVERMEELSVKIEQQAPVVEHMRAVQLGDKNIELDAMEAEVERLRSVVQAMKDDNVVEVADYALRYLMTRDQKKIQEYSRKIAKQLLYGQTSAAFDIWRKYSTYVYNVQVMERFLRRYRNRTVIAAFRQWEMVVVEERPKTPGFAKGLIMNLSKRKKDKYRLMVISK